MESDLGASALTPAEFALFVCDLQEAFRPVIPEFNGLVETAKLVMDAAKLFAIPIICSEQNPDRLGRTVPAILSGDVSVPVFSKMTFSMVAAGCETRLFLSNNSNVRSIILIGIESHICILQTALDLVSMNYRVYLIYDGVASRYDLDKKIAVKQLAANGVIVTTAESLLFQFLGTAQASEFKKISSLVKARKEWRDCQIDART